METEIETPGFKESHKGDDGKREAHSLKWYPTCLKEMLWLGHFPPNWSLTIQVPRLDL